MELTLRLIKYKKQKQVFSVFAFFDSLRKFIGFIQTDKSSFLREMDQLST